MISARVRLSIESSMKVAGRKMEESTSTPGRPGRISASACSTPRVTSMVFAHGSFSTMSISPSPSLITASPISGWWPSTRSATSWSWTWRPSWVRIGIVFMSSEVTIGCTCRTLARCSVPSSHPPRPMK